MGTSLKIILGYTASFLGLSFAPVLYRIIAATVFLLSEDRSKWPLPERSWLQNLIPQFMGNIKAFNIGAIIYILVVAFAMVIISAWFHANARQEATASKDENEVLHKEFDAFKLGHPISNSDIQPIIEVYNQTDSKRSLSNGGFTVEVRPPAGMWKHPLLILPVDESISQEMVVQAGDVGGDPTIVYTRFSYQDIMNDRIVQCDQVINISKSIYICGINPPTEFSLFIKEQSKQYDYRYISDAQQYLLISK